MMVMECNNSTTFSGSLPFFFFFLFGNSCQWMNRVVLFYGGIQNKSEKKLRDVGGVAFFFFFRGPCLCPSSFHHHHLKSHCNDIIEKYLHFLLCMVLVGFILQIFFFLYYLFYALPRLSCFHFHFFLVVHVLTI